MIEPPAPSPLPPQVPARRATEQHAHAGTITDLWTVEPVNAPADGRRDGVPEVSRRTADNGSRSSTEYPETTGRWPRPTGVSIAACAVAVLGAVTTGAFLLPSNEATAAADSLTCQPRLSPVPTKHRPHRAAHRHHSPGSTAETALRGLSAAPAATHGQTAAPTTATPTPTPSTPTSAPSSSTAPRPSSSASAAADVAGSAVSAPVSDLRGVVAKTAAGARLSLTSGVYGFSNFDATSSGVYLRGTSLIGQGIGKTVLKMTPHSSTKAGLVPTAKGSSNILSLLRVNGGSPVLSGFTLQGTAQGHLYNGLHVDGTANARISGVKIAAVPGNDHIPPGETAGIGDVHTSGSRYSNIEVDGAGLGAAGFNAASSSNLTIDGFYTHDNRYSAGVAVWNTRNVTLNNIRSENNRIGINLEQVTGTVTIDRPTIRGNTQDIYIGSSIGSAKITITDPVLDGTKLHIRMPVQYADVPNTQLRSTIQVLVHGVDRTEDDVEWER